MNDKPDNELWVSVSKTKRPNAAILREQMTVVLRLIDAGYGLKAIYEGLKNDHGCTWTFQAFKNQLHRSRKGATAKPPRDQEARQAVKPEDEMTPNARLTKRQQREKNADEFVNPINSNPLLKRILGKKNENSGD